ncbi:hypothetical protein HKBW3S42_01790, partial [Candidatus Hakubella thermalkaliphila]
EDVATHDKLAKNAIKVNGQAYA